MSSAGTPSTDPWVIVARERARYEEQFKSLKPVNGVVTGDQAKGLFLQSQLPPLVLGQIWGLADTDADGKMDIAEFSIACKLINLKLRGFEIPKVLPPNLVASLRMYPPPPVAAAAPPPIAPPTIANQPPKIPPLPIQPIAPPQIPALPTIAAHNPPPLIPGIGAAPIQSQPIGFGGVAVVPPLISAPPVLPMATVPPMSAAPPPIQLGGINQVPILTSNIPAFSPPAISQVTPSGSVSSSGPGATSTPRASITSLDRMASLDKGFVDALQMEWSVPHQTKLKYTQMFNTTDRSRSGYLSGVQARNVMVQSKLPQPILAQIWALSDMDSDGRLGCEEFVLAMHLCEQALQGVQLPTKLPLDLIPPSFRRGPRTASISSQGSGQPEQDPASTLPSSSFEDKRKENYEKGQAELERRRKSLLEQQRKEAEERERKEREEQERKLKARLEAERRRMDELEKQMREQQEQERVKEEERKRQAEQRESARREIERQRQLEWEKQRSQDLQQQRQREQETVLKLKAKNQSLTIELTSLNDQVKELSQKICDTRVGVSNVKSTIDGMRSTRDAQMQEMSQLKNKLKEQNARLLALSQERVKLEARNKLNAQLNDDQCEQTKQAFENKEITIKNLREKIEDLQSEVENKMSDIDNNNTQLSELRAQMSQLISDCEKLYDVYEGKRNKVLETKNAAKSDFATTAWKSNDDAWGQSTNAAATEWPVADNWNASSGAKTSESGGLTAPAIKYRALYEFVARNSDEISFQPGDIINVPAIQTGEPGWLAGEIKGHTGWFPESYVEMLDTVTAHELSKAAPSVDQEEEVETKRLEGISEISEPIVEPAEPAAQPFEPTPEPEAEISPQVLEYCIASYPYQSMEQGDLSFNSGDVIGVVKKDGDWWTGKLDGNVGIFPCNYVQRYDPNSSTNPVSAASVEKAFDASVAAAHHDATQSDNEVSQINEMKAAEKSPDYGTAQIIKGTKKPEIASVIAPYQSTSNEQLSLQRGQLIMIRKKTDSGWWEGELQAKGRKRQVGWFPASYVKVLNSSGRTSGRSTPVSTTRMQQEVVIDKVVALYPYTAANVDELTFQKDDIISVTSRDEPSWWKGELNGVSGLFPSNYVAPLQQSADPQSKKRKDCINELIQTEKAYIDDMTVVYEVFEIPLRQSGVVTTTELTAIFVNWQEILQCNKNFLQDLMARKNAGSDLFGDLICAHLPRMTAYITFCSKQLESASLLQRLTESSAAFRDVVKRCQAHRLTKGMPLSSFLIKPMQRITRYPLLISKIIDNTPENHTDHANLTDALQIADRFLKRLNENVRLRENEERLEWLQVNVTQTDHPITFNSTTNKLGPRKLVHFGMLTKVTSGKELIGFLFNDFLLLVQPSKGLNGSQFNFLRNTNMAYKVYKQPILIKDLEAAKGSSDNVENGTDANRVLKLRDRNHNKKSVISLLTPTINECNLWLKRIEGAQEIYKKVHQLTKSRSKSRKSYCDNVYCKVAVGGLEQLTDVAMDNINNGNAPQNGAPPIPVLVWNYSMQFPIKRIDEDTLTIMVFERCPFQPDEFLGRADLRIRDIYTETKNTNGPITKKLILHQVESGELTIKLDLHMFNHNY